MTTAPKNPPTNKGNGATTTELASQLWATANALRGNIDAAEYKHVVLPLMFLKYISDAFEELHEELESKADEGHDPEQPDEYKERNVFWVPQEARWTIIQSRARQEDNGATIDRAMDVIERDNDSLKGVLPRNFGRDDLDKQVLGQVVDLVSNIKVGGTQARATDVLGQVYEYFLEQFAIAEGRKGGEFYTPRSVVRLLVEMIEPYEGRVFDPCCGSAGMFVQSVKFIEAHAKGNGNGNGKNALRNLSIHGQESNQTTLRLAKMNLAIRGIDANIQFGDSFRNDRHPDLKADYILANPPFNISDWSGNQLRDDKRWAHGTPPVGNANYAWVQHFLHHLSPRGIAGFVLANGSMSSNQSGEGEIRKNIVEANLVDCIIALPGQLFRSTQIPACLWFLSRSRSRRRDWDRQGQTLFIDARKMGNMLNRTLRDLSEEDIARIAGTYHAWRDGEAYEDEPGFCKSATLEEIQRHGHVLTPGRYVGAAPQEDDGEPFQEKMTRLTAQWREQQAEAQQLGAEIATNLERLGF